MGNYFCKRDGLIKSNVQKNNDMVPKTYESESDDIFDDIMITKISELDDIDLTLVEDNSNVVCFNEQLIYDILFTSTISKKQYEQRMRLWNFLQENKKNTKTALIYPFVCMIGYLESLDKRYLCVQNDYSYIQILFYSMIYGTINLIQLDDRILNIIHLILSDPDEYNVYRIIKKMFELEQIELEQIELEQNEYSQHTDKYKDRKLHMKKYDLYIRDKDNESTWYHVKYYSELIREIFGLDLEPNDENINEMKKRRELYDFLEKNKNNESGICMSSPKSFTLLLNILQSEIGFIWTIDLIQINVSIIFLAKRFGYLKLYNEILRVLILILDSHEIYEEMRKMFIMNKNIENVNDCLIHNDKILFSN